MRSGMASRRAVKYFKRSSLSGIGSWPRRFAAKHITCFWDASTHDTRDPLLKATDHPVHALPPDTLLLQLRPAIPHPRPFPAATKSGQSSMFTPDLRADASRSSRRLHRLGRLGRRLDGAQRWSRSNRPDCLNAESSKKAWPLADLPQHVAALQGTLTPQMSDRETGLALDMPARKKAQASIQRRAQHHKALAPLQGAAGLSPKPGP